MRICIYTYSLVSKYIKINPYLVRCKPICKLSCNETVKSCKPICKPISILI